MPKISSVLVGAALVSTVGCSQPDPPGRAPGTEVTIEMPDGSLVTGRIAESGVRTAHATDPGADLAAVPVSEGSGPDADPPPAPEPVVSAAELPPMETTVPAGTTVSLTLDTALASDLSRVDDPIRARVALPVVIDDVEAIPAGSLIHGAVTSATTSGKVQGRAQLSFRFHRLDIGDGRHDVRSGALWYRAESTKKDDATTIGIGAGAGALIGGLLGGGRGASTGAVVGGGAGTAMVLGTAGPEVELRPGTRLEIELEEPLVIPIPLAATN